MGVRLRIPSNPLLFKLPALIVTLLKPDALETVKLMISSFVILLYHVASIEARPSNRPTSNPPSVDVVISGFRLALAMTSPSVNRGSPANFVDRPLYVVASLYGSASAPTRAFEPRSLRYVSGPRLIDGKASERTSDVLTPGYE